MDKPPTNERTYKNVNPMHKSGPEDTFYGVPTEDITMGMEGEDDLILHDTQASAPSSDLTNAKTPLGGEDVGVLGETGDEYQLSDDMLSETKAASDEVSLEEIEEDVNLDTFGSGSGLLDLSLQADDTSLGGILEEIYNAEGECAEEPKEASATVVGTESGLTLPSDDRRSLLHRLKSIPVSHLFNRFKPAPKAEKWLIGLSFWMPRKYREYITGDILEDCEELRESNYGEWRVRAHVIWHFIIAVIMLWPEAIGGVIGAVVRRILNTKN